MKKILLASLTVLCTVWSVPGAGAHATPSQYIPAASSVLEAAPPRVSIRFSERIEPGVSSITVYDSAGNTVVTGGKTDPADAHIFFEPLALTGTGTYSVSWQVVSSDDGHFTRGAFVFSVGVRSGFAETQGQISVEHSSGWPEAILIFLELLGEAIVIGAIAFVILLRRRVPSDALAAFVSRISILLYTAFGLVVTGAVLYLLLKSNELAFDRSIPFSPAFSSFVWTVAGKYTVFRLVSGAVLIVIFLLNLRRLLSEEKFGKAGVTIFILILLTALFRARVSHAAASSFLPAFSILINAVHLISKDLWIGGLVVFVFAVLPALKNQSLASRVRVWLWLGRLLTIALAVGGVSGAYIVWLHLKSPINLFTTHWGGYFLVLSVYAVLLVLLRLYQEFRVHPALVRVVHGPSTLRDQETANGAETFLVTEMMVALGVLLFSSILIITTPPLSFQNLYSETKETRNAVITFSEDSSDENQFLVTVKRKDTPQTATGILTVLLTNEEKGIGPVVANTEQRSAHGYVFPRSEFTPSGTWKVEVTEQQESVFDAVASFTITTPDDILAAHANDHARVLDTFGMVVLGVVVLLLVFSYILRRRSVRLLAELIANNGSTVPVLGAKQRLVVLLFALVLVVFIGYEGGHSHGASGFAKQCAEASGYWHESVAVRDGVAVSSISSLGCTLGMGQGTFHFTDVAELSWFMRRSNPYVKMQSTPSVLMPGQEAVLTFVIKDEKNQPVTGLTREHDRILHAVAVSKDQTSFAHLHVEDTAAVDGQMIADGTFPVRYTFPRAGTYLIGVDYTVRSQTFADHFIVTVGAPGPETPTQAPSRIKTFEGMQVTLGLPDTPLKAGVTQKLTYNFTQDGKPVTDLEPYLSAAMHVSVVKNDQKKFIHTHAELPQSLWDSVFSPRDPNAKHFHQFLPEKFGPHLVSYVLFPVPGTYELFGEVKKDGKTILTQFTVEVE